MNQFEFVVNNFALDRKIKEASSELKPSSQWALMEFENDKDKELIASFIQQWPNEADGVPMSPNTKRAYIDALLLLSRHVKENLNGSIYKPFAEMTKQDIVDGYLKSLKKELSKDEQQKWVNTYNTRAAKHLAFWKWLIRHITEELDALNVVLTVPIAISSLPSVRVGSARISGQS
ncbi:MAG: hypothetical protein ACJ70Q_03915 [Nitrososphaera sp.]